MAAQPDVKQLLETARQHRAELDAMLANKTAQERLDIKELPVYKQKVKLLREANASVQELRTKQRDYLDTLIKQEGSAKKLTGIYTSIGALEQKRLQTRKKPKLLNKI